MWRKLRYHPNKLYKDEIGSREKEKTFLEKFGFL